MRRAGGAETTRMRVPTILVVVLALAVLGTVAGTASAETLSLTEAHTVAVTKMRGMERELKTEGAQDSSVRGCWRERRGVGCLGLVSGKDSLLRWRCAVPMTIRKRATASAARRVAVKFTAPMCSF